MQTTTEQWDQFAPEAASKEGKFLKELRRKRAWIRSLRGLPPWQTKQETLCG